MSKVASLETALTSATHFWAKNRTTFLCQNLEILAQHLPTVLLSPILLL